MKKLFITLFASTFFLACSKDESNTIPPEPTINLQGFSYDIGEITPTSMELEYVSTSVSGTGGKIIREIWYKKATDLEWSKKDITDEVVQRTHLLEGLEKATKYIVKPVFSIENITKEGLEKTVTTLPFKFSVRKYRLHEAHLYLTDNAEDTDFRELDATPYFFVEHGGDTLDLKYTTLSKDSILISLDSNSSILFQENDILTESLDLPLHFKLNDYYNNDILQQNFQIYNNQPKIDSLIVQQVIDCEDLQRTRLAFKGLFWDPLNPPSTPNGPDNYRVKISSVQNPSVSTPIMTLSEFDINSSSFTNGCKDGFRTVIDIPVENLFHRGSVLWVIFPKDLLPEGAYEIQFSVIKNDETYSADPLEFDLVYE
tara:strand:- start:1017 stop:2129 length:1113 start_codon:yes stop_codon:yes gene_type:complete